MRLYPSDRPCKHSSRKDRVKEIRQNRRPGLPARSADDDPLGCAVVDASREVARRPMAPALALLGPWLALALIAAFRDGGSSDTGLTIAAVGAILACALALLLAAIGRLELPRPTGAGLVALAGLGLWCAVALASISWSLSPADSWQDGIHVACAAAALAGGMWIGALLVARPRPPASSSRRSRSPSRSTRSRSARSAASSSPPRSRGCASRSATRTRWRRSSCRAFPRHSCSGADGALSHAQEAPRVSPCSPSP